MCGLCLEIELDLYIYVHMFMMIIPTQGGSTYALQMSDYKLLKLLCLTCPAKLEKLPNPHVRNNVAATVRASVTLG